MRRHPRSGTFRRPALLVSLLVVAIGGGYGCGGKRAAEEKEARAIRAKVRTVAIASLRSATGAVTTAQVEAAFLGRTTERLTAAGLRVVVPEVWDESWRRHARDVGGVFDAVTGAADEEKRRSVEAATRRELAATHAVDAILHLSVETVESFGVAAPPRACGTAVPPYWPGGWYRWGHGATLVRTACLSGRLVDPSGEPYFARQDSIEGIETYDQQTRAVRPPADLFQDATSLDRATERVLRPLLGPGPRVTASAPVTPTDRP